MKRLFFCVAFACVLCGSAASAQTIDLQQIVGQGNGATSGRIIQILVGMTVLSLAPGLLITVTCFTRFIIALSFLRSGLGLPTTPANLILISLALFMTSFVMAPIFEKSWDVGVKPLLENKITESEAFPKIVEPFRQFMLIHTREKDVKLFQDLAMEKLSGIAVTDRTDLRIVIPAFMVSELRRGFEIGFLILLPFLIIDLIVATLTMSMGMMMLSPTVIALPFKVLFFVLFDGWYKITGSLVRSFF